MIVLRAGTFLTRFFSSGIFGAIALAGCSIHPTPDDVTQPFRTEDVVRHARCEIRSAIFEWLRQSNLVALDATEDEVLKILARIKDKTDALEKRNHARAPAQPKPLDSVLEKPELKIKRYTDIAIAYDFNFNITETNTTDGSLGFKLPFTSPAQLEIGTSASLHLTRQGQRQFKATDRWSRILARTECSKLPGRDRNIVYPISGSLGLDRLIHTFISISEQGGARDNFVETLTFTTEADASYTAGLKLNAKPQSLRLVSAGLAGAAGRTDVHRMIISLAFPSVRGPEAISGVERYDGDLNAPFDRSAPWRARYNLCVSDARGREDEFKVLRHQPPEVYCITYADAFAPGEGATVVVRARSTVTGIAPKPASRSLERSSDERSIKPGTAPQERIILNRRPNLF